MVQIASLLADNGEYNTQDAELNTITDCDKVQFLEWLTTQAEYDSEEVDKLMAHGTSLRDAIESVLTAKRCKDIWTAGHSGLGRPRLYIPPDLAG